MMAGKSGGETAADPLMSAKSMSGCAVKSCGGVEKAGVLCHTIETTSGGSPTSNVVNQIRERLGAT